DVYFVRVVRGGIVSYQVIHPPVGAVITALPVGHTTVLIGGVTHYRYEGITYAPRAGGFVVIAI
ncbi:MAG: DUF6515 family protein, partial [Acidobacteriota bacterium]